MYHLCDAQVAELQPTLELLDNLLLSRLLMGRELLGGFFAGIQTCSRFSLSGYSTCLGVYVKRIPPPPPNTHTIQLPPSPPSLPPSHPHTTLCQEDTTPPPKKHAHNSALPLPSHHLMSTVIPTFSTDINPLEQ